MAKKQKLYIKNDKGRYEEYNPVLKTDDSDLLFSKVGNEYDNPELIDNDYYKI